MVNMTLNVLARIGIILFSSLAIPYLVKLIIGIYKRIKINKHPDKRTAYVMLFLFSALLILSILSIIITSCAFFGVRNILINHMSQTRSFFLSITNFISSVIFYNIYLDGEKLSKKKK